MKTDNYMKTSKIICGIVGLLILPIGFYLQFWIISQLNADRLIWFLYWIHIPAMIIIMFIQKLIED